MYRPQVEADRALITAGSPRVKALSTLEWPTEEQFSTADVSRAEETPPHKRRRTLSLHRPRRRRHRRLRALRPGGRFPDRPPVSQPRCRRGRARVLVAARAHPRNRRNFAARPFPHHRISPGRACADAATFAKTLHDLSQHSRARSFFRLGRRSAPFGQFTGKQRTTCLLGTGRFASRRRPASSRSRFLAVSVRAHAPPAASRRPRLVYVRPNLPPQFYAYALFAAYH